jgi:hypothetical protein
MIFKPNQGEILMNKYSKKILIAMQLCSIVLLTLFVSAVALAQMLANASTDGTSKSVRPHVGVTHLGRIRTVLDNFVTI